MGIPAETMVIRVDKKSGNKIQIMKERTMKSSIRDKTEGKFHELKGKVREMAGKITDNPKLRAKGKAEKIAGNIQEKIGQVKKVLGK